MQDNEVLSFAYPCRTENIPTLVHGCSEGAAYHGAGFHAGDQHSGWFEQRSSFLPQPFRVVDPLLAAMEVGVCSLMTLHGNVERMSSNSPMATSRCTCCRRGKSRVTSY